MSHYYTGPDFGLPHGDARLDLTDLHSSPSQVCPYSQATRENIAVESTPV
jgi:organic hydroperoxide reductase OsmC/OhrA